jgi:hypothetical protein
MKLHQINQIPRYSILKLATVGCDMRLGGGSRSRKSNLLSYPISNSSTRKSKSGKEKKGIESNKESLFLSNELELREISNFFLKMTGSVSLPQTYVP